MNLFRRARPRERVRVHLKNADPSIEGFLLSEYPVAGGYRLADARMIEAEDRSFALDGITVVPVDNVLFMQRMGADA